LKSKFIQVQDIKPFLPEGHVLTDAYEIVGKSIGLKNMSIYLTIINPGGAAEAHVHPREDQVYYVVDGQAEMRLEDTVLKLSPNTAVYIPAGTLHETRTIGSAPLKLLTVLVPP
jgi:mannose-6-phosphate isomerase-like protein (cupin superfamily)